MLVALLWPPIAPAAEKVKVTIPAAAVTFASLYHAKLSGSFTDEGLDVGIVTVSGGGSLQALIARGAQFCVTPGTYQMQAFEKDQRLLATAAIMNRNAINVVMHKDVAREKGITDKSPLADKIRALKGQLVTNDFLPKQAPAYIRGRLLERAAAWAAVRASGAPKNGRCTRVRP